MQVVEYMKMNNYHPNKPSLLRQEKTWYDPDAERSEIESTTTLLKTVSSASISSIACSGEYQL